MTTTRLQNTEEVMDDLDMSQARFGKIDKFGQWDLESFQKMQDRN